MERKCRSLVEKYYNIIFILVISGIGIWIRFSGKDFISLDMTHYFVFCKHFLEKVAKYFWRMLHLQIGESCKASAGSYPASHIAIADHI